MCSHMTDFDPYAILGVAHTASAAAIKSAYRLRVQTAHPDRGGAPENFIALVKAFGVLSDSEARRLFDETGLIDDQGIKTYRQEVIAILADMFDAAVRSAVDSALDLATVDFITHMRTAVSGSTLDAKRVSAKLDREIEALRALRNRIRRADREANLFVDRLSTQIKAKVEQHAAARRRVGMLEMAAVELSNYSSEVELIAALEAPLSEAG